MSSGIASLLGLLAGALWVMWLGMGLAPVWIGALALGRFESARSGHGLLWPPSWRGAPPVVRAASLGGFLCASLLFAIEPAILPPLLGLGAGILAVAASSVCGLGLDLVSLDLLRCRPTAGRGARVLACALLPLRMILSFVLLRASPRPIEELSFPLTLGIWRPLSLLAAPPLFLLEAVLLVLAARELDRAPPNVLATSTAEREHRRRHLAALTPLGVLGVAALLAGLLHTDEVAIAVGRWIAH